MSTESELTIERVRSSFSQRERNVRVQIEKKKRMNVFFFFSNGCQLNN